jgi:hypothetical protein
MENLFDRKDHALLSFTRRECFSPWDRIMFQVLEDPTLMIYHSHTVTNSNGSYRTIGW